MDNMEYANPGLTKKRMRQDKRELKQIGNQQKRTREKAALRDMINGDTEFIPDFNYDKPSEYMNGIDRVEEPKERGETTFAFDNDYHMDSQICDLQSKNAKLIKFLEAQEAWEKMMLNDDSINWVDNMTEEIQEAFYKVQKLRNEAK